MDEGVDGKDGSLGLCLGVVHNVEIHELLQLQVGGADALHNVREQLRYILAHRHGSDDLGRDGFI